MLEPVGGLSWLKFLNQAQIRPIEPGADEKLEILGNVVLAQDDEISALRADVMRLTARVIILENQSGNLPQVES